MSGYESVAKKRQTEFREFSPTISQKGRLPQDKIGQKHGHLLALDCEEENLYPALRGEEGVQEFFSEREIKWHRHHRSGDPKDMVGPTRNMVSSQIACVNFLLPLCEIPDALAAVARAIDDDVNDVIPLHDNGRVSLVEFEWTGLCHPLEKDAASTRGANVTSIDAFIVVTTANGLRAYLMEWKYTEKYGFNQYKGKGKSGETRRCRYAPLYAESSSFTGEVPMDEFLYEPFYQIMRLRLLADRMVEKKEFDVSEAKVIVVVPQEHSKYRKHITSSPLAQRFPKLDRVEEVFGATLKRPNDAFAMVSPALLVDAIERECGDAALDWVAYQRERYGW